jgi:nucleoid-associated protein YgaU
MISAFFKANPQLAWLIAGVIAIGGGTGAYLYSQNRNLTQEPQSVSESAQKQNEADSALQAESGSPEALQGAEEPSGANGSIIPRFDVLRLEQNGSAVIAGSAPPSSQVEILANGEVIARAQAGPAGDFAVVLEEPLGEGGHELKIRAQAADGTTIVSQETGIVNVPGTEGELIAMVDREGAPPRILQGPERAQALSPGAEETSTQELQQEPQTEPQEDSATKEPQTEKPQAEDEAVATTTPESSPETPEAEPTAESAEDLPATPQMGEPEIAAPVRPSDTEAAEIADSLVENEIADSPSEREEDEAVSDENIVEEAEQEREVASLPPPAEEESAQETGTAQDSEDISPVLVEAVDVEGETIYIAGVGEPGRQVNLYLDGEFLGGALVGSQGGFLLEITKLLEDGSYEIRADMLSQDRNTVSRRAAVRLVHESENIAQASQTETADLTQEETGEPMATAEAPVAESIDDDLQTEVESSMEMAAAEQEETIEADVEAEPIDVMDARDAMETEDASSLNEAVNAGQVPEISTLEERGIQAPATEEGDADQTVIVREVTPGTGRTAKDRVQEDEHEPQPTMMAVDEDKIAGEEQLSSESQLPAQSVPAVDVDESILAELTEASPVPVQENEPAAWSDATIAESADDESASIASESRDTKTNGATEAEVPVETMDDKSESGRMALQEQEARSDGEPVATDTPDQPVTERADSPETEPVVQTATPETADSKLASREMQPVEQRVVEDSAIQPEGAEADIPEQTVEQAETGRATQLKVATPLVQDTSEKAAQPERTDPVVQEVIDERALPEEREVTRQATAEAAPEAEAEVVESRELVSETTPDIVEESAAPELPVIRTGESVIIRRGDNLWRISRRMLGRGIRYTVIYEANREQIRNPHLIYPGQVFDVPGAMKPMDR